MFNFTIECFCKELTERDILRAKRLAEHHNKLWIEIFRAGLKVWEDRYKLLPIKRG